MRDSDEFSLNQPIQPISIPREVDLVEAKQTDQYGRNALLQAAFQGNLERVKQLAQHKELLNQDNDGNTALHLAGLESHIDVVSYLLDHVHGKILLALNKRRESIFPILQENGLLDLFLKLMRRTGIIVHDRPIDHKTLVELNSTIITGLRKERFTNLDLSDVAITDHSFEYLINGLAKHYRLTHISLQNTLLTHQSMELLSEWLREDTQLQSLNLSENQIGSRFLLRSGVSYIAKSLEKNKTLEKLSLVHCHLDDSDIRALTRMLRHNIFLSELRLGENPAISKKALRNMLKSLLAHAHGLKILDLGNHYNRVFKNSLRHVLDSSSEQEVKATASDTSSYSFLEQLKEDLGPDLASDDIKPMDSKFKDELAMKRKANKLTKEDRLLLFKETIREQQEAYQHSKSIIKDKVAYFQIQEELQRLSQHDQKYIPVKVSWDKQGERLAHLEEETAEHAKTRQQEYKASLEHRFEITLQRKLSLYWLAVGCLESKLIQPSNEEVEQTLKHLQIIIALLSMVPVLSEAHDVAHGALGMLGKVYELLHEVMESLHFVEFLSEIPVAHHAFHYLAKKLSQFKTISQEQMLENVGHAFGDWEMCAEQCQQIAKAITHRYEWIGKLDSLEDAEKLAEFTAGMILDFYKIGGHQEHGGDYIEISDAILDWLFYSSGFYYKNKKQPVVLVEGEEYQITQFYTAPRLVFRAEDEQQKPITVTIDMRIQDKTKREMIKTHSPILKRKGSKKEAEWLKHCFQANGGNKEGKEMMLKSKYVTFYLRDMLCENATDIQAFEFTFKTKSQRLKDLEGIVGRQDTKIDILLKNIATLSKTTEIKQTQLVEELAKKEIEIINIKEEIATFKSKFEKIENDRNQITSQNALSHNTFSSNGIFSRRATVTNNITEESDVRDEKIETTYN